MKLIITVLLFLSGLTFSQSKYLIYFKDKGIEKTGTLSKNSSIYNEAVNSLSEKAIERRQKVLGENFITYEDLPINSNYIQEIESSGIKLINKLKWFNAVSAILNEDQFQKISGLNFVEKIEKVHVFKKPNEKYHQNELNKNSQTNDNNYGASLNQLNLSNIPLVHKNNITGKGVRIGVLDSGFDWKNHEALKNSKVIAEYDFVFGDSITANQNGDTPGQDNHGTYCFSIISGMMQGKLIGSAYEAEFVLAKTEDIGSETHTEEDNYAAALEWMENLGVDITSSSLGYSEFDSPDFSYTYENMDGKTTIVTIAAEFAFERGVLTVTSAGNEGNNSSWFYITAPADGINTIAVGAVNSKGELASFSSRGPTYDGRIKPDISTQGIGVYGAASGSISGYSNSSGTSAACPIASGSAGLILSAFPHLTNVQLRNLIHQSGDSSFAPNNRKGYGILKADKALNFPNIEKISESEIVLHKAFIDETGITQNSINIFYSETDSNFDQTNLSSSAEFSYKFTIPQSFNPGKIYFYYTYNNATGETKRSPQTGLFKYSYGNLNVEIIESGLVDVDPVIPTAFELKQNYPNPFNASTKIEYDAVKIEPVELSIYDVMGKRIYKEERISKLGKNEFLLNGNKLNWNAISSGVYYYVLKTPTVKDAKKMVLLK